MYTTLFTILLELKYFLVGLCYMDLAKLKLYFPECSSGILV